MILCTPQSGALLPKDLVIVASATATGDKCTSTFAYTVNAHVDTDTTAYQSRVMR